MRRASSSLLSYINSSHLHPRCCRVFSRTFVSDISPVTTKENPSTFTPHNIKSCNKSHGLLLRNIKLNQFQTTPSRNQNTLVEKTPPLNPRQRKIKEKSDIEEAFKSATTTEDIMRAFKDMETAFGEDDMKLGLACLKVGLHFEREGEEPGKILEFANRALSVFDKNDKWSLPVAMTLHLMGSVCYTTKRFNDSLGYLNRANRILGKLESEGYGAEDIKPVLHAVQLELANTKTAMGRREEALANHKKCLEIKESTLGVNSKEVGIANRELAEAYVAVLNFKEALPHCLTALVIHKSQLGDNSVEVAHDRRLLGVIYTGMEEHQKALEQNELCKRVLKNWGLNSELLHAEIDAANMQIALGRYEEAVNILKGVVQQTDKDSKNRAVVFVAMANALCNQEKFTDSKRCLQISCGILDKKESEFPVEVAEAYMEIAMLYETMNDFEVAITLYKRTLSILEKEPQEQHSEGSASARLGWLLMLTGKVPQAIPYLESAAERLKESFGPKHFGVGYIYNNLGAAYLELDRPQSAAQVFAVAKEIMDVALGPHHTDSIEACQNLSKAYGAMGSYALAMQFQQRAIDAWESHGPSARDEVREAHRLLEQLKKKAQCTPEDVVECLTKALPMPPHTREESVYSKS